MGDGALAALADHLAEERPGALAVVVSDSQVAPLHGVPLAEAIRARGGRAEVLTFPAGEVHKTRETKAGLEDGLLRLQAGRDTAIVAVGGGVTGDLAGFLAATWQRGVPLYQVPTSLLAMVDAAIGGKTGVDLPYGKNLVGAFHQPAALAVDPRVLETLPDAELRAGCAEVVKLAAVADASLFARLEREAEALLARDRAVLDAVVSRCIALKARIVARDEREAGVRASLNFGHTVGHALERLSGYAVAHGHAVAVGCAVEATMAVHATGFPPPHRARLVALLRRFGLPTAWPEDIPVEAALPAMRTDKKARGGRVRYALPARLGRMPAGPLPIEVDDEVARLALAEAARIDTAHRGG
jgi:3-dehydroquinate synthase